MKAIRFSTAVPRYALGKTLGSAFPGVLWGGWSCTFFDEVPEPVHPNEEWVTIETHLGGICGSDLGAIFLYNSPYYTPFTSSPFTLGHESVGRITAAGAEAGDWQVGERVVVEPLLWCRPRGFTDYCTFCARGEINRCERYTEGVLSPALMTGLCRDTGGSWSPRFLAHPSQLYRVPASITAEESLLVEPFAVGLHAVLQNWPRAEDRVLIVGAGTIGLMTLAALKGLGAQARVSVLARYPFQAEAARKLGADEVILSRGQDTYQMVADSTQAQVLKPLIGKRVITGGYAITYECVGSEVSIDDSLRFTHNGGKIVLVGVPGLAKGIDWSNFIALYIGNPNARSTRLANGIDWTAIFAQELTVSASNYYHHAETYAGKTWRAFDLAIDLIQKGAVDLGWLVTHRYPLTEYPRALADTKRRSSLGLIKGVFEFGG